MPTASRRLLDLEVVEDGRSYSQYRGTRNVAVPPWIVRELQLVADEDFVSIDQACVGILRQALVGRLRARINGEHS